MLFGRLDEEEEALWRRKAVYDEARSYSNGSEICGRCSDSDYGSVAELEVGSESPTLESVGVMAGREGELVEGGHGPLRPDGRARAVLGKRVQRVESALHPEGLAPKRLRNTTMGQGNQGRHQQGGWTGGEEGLEGGDRDTASGVCQGSAWTLVAPGGEVLVAGRYTMEAVQSQVILQGPVGRDIWLAVDLRSGKGRKGERRSHAGRRAVRCREELQAMLIGLRG